MNLSKKTIRIIALMLAVLMLTASLFSCNVQGGNGSDQGAKPGPGEDSGFSGGNSSGGNESENTGETFSEKGIFFSSSAPAGGDGSHESPYNSLNVISNLTVTPGTYIYLERGSEFFGSFSLKNIHGTDDEPVVVTPYGKGKDPKIDGNDHVGTGVLYIENCSNLTVSGLEITDKARTQGDRRGVLVVCNNNEASNRVITYENITLKDLYIHDIMGFRDAENSGMAMESKITGGIHVWSEDGLGRVDGLDISECRITEVSNVGIATWYHVIEDQEGIISVKKVSPYANNFGDYAHKNVNISKNEINYIGKNAIFARHLLGGVIEHNVIHDTAIYCVSGNTIVTSFVDGTVIQYNEGYRNMASARESDNKLQDGCMLDADLASKDTVWQYNYSHDNSFGLFLNCTYNNANYQDKATVRYNLSVNDRGQKGIIYINQATAGIYVYNNTIITSYDTEYIIQSNGEGRISYFYNNLIYNRSDKAKFDIAQGCTMTAESNLIYNEYGSAIADMEYFTSINKDGIYDSDPLFTGYLPEDSTLGVSNQSAYILDGNSPALGVGKEIAVVKDFFGNAYKKSIGFYCG